MRILQVLPALNSGGVERGTIDLSQALVAQGHDSFCVSQGGQLVSTLEASGGKHIQLPVHSKNPVTIWRNIGKLTALIKQQEIDLVHVRSRAPAWSVHHASRRSGIPMISTFHGQYGSHSKLKRWYNSGMLKADTTIAVSDFIMHHIAETYPKQHGRLTRIYRGVNTDYFSINKVNDETRQALSLSWGLPPNAQNIIMLPGRLARLKGHEKFIEALSMLASEHYHAVVVGETAGREEYIRELQSQAQALGIRTSGPQQQLYFAGGCTDMPTAYSLSDIVVSASTKPEAFGRTTCEAQSMGKLVVATAHGGSCETLHPSQQAGMCQPSDSKSLAAALERQLGTSRETRTEISIASRQHVIQHFSLTNMCNETVDLYQQVLTRHAATEH